MWRLDEEARCLLNDEKVILRFSVEDGGVNILGLKTNLAGLQTIVSELTHLDREVHVAAGMLSRVGATKHPQDALDYIRKTAAEIDTGEIQLCHDCVHPIRMHGGIYLHPSIWVCPVTTRFDLVSGQSSYRHCCDIRADGKPCSKFERKRS